ncbi:hypothetical protein G6F56_013029 [Rhizopus delemar]|uniref:Rieske domain-containing protein n=1 Tax=Rhizopus stolonifer TaxID=4846 RepID=A0A367KWW7_RHIST|nr:hypothetical protein G6F56_013029 [Rhizopus delemar]RCI06372.1 hypothetical protein CU098_010991 [Rhizopus stolonifer]
MFEPTIKYRRVNETQESVAKQEQSVKKEVKQDIKQNKEEPKEEPKEQVKEKNVADEYIFEEEEDTDAIQVDPNNSERIIVTLSTGKQYSTDRYCPHAGADLSYHGKLGEHEYPPEIGPIVMCQFHYWEFALERNGDGFGGRATINACPVADKCSSKLDW